MRDDRVLGNGFVTPDISDTATIFEFLRNLAAKRLHNLLLTRRSSRLGTPKVRNHRRGNLDAPLRRLLDGRLHLVVGILGADQAQIQHRQTMPDRGF
jgi:hypothetical protein